MALMLVSPSFSSFSRMSKRYTPSGDNNCLLLLNSGVWGHVYRPEVGHVDTLTAALDGHCWDGRSRADLWLARRTGGGTHYGY